MNCEKCKKKEASVFYADEVGGRHSLCAVCAAALGKVSQYDPTNDQKSHSTPYIPTPTLTSLCNRTPELPRYYSATEKELSSTCPYCSTSLESIINKGIAGCPECYTAFCDILFPASLTAESARGARMPSSRRDSIDRIRSIKDLRARIKVAIETENYELAASLRDDIRKLEAQKLA
ncbi:MAG: hypothetical protein E7611_00705 [Ruminococcaceae bacterium]|nr:hypothetical protein [Oscillospiraceae bacterium]